MRLRADVNVKFCIYFNFINFNFMNILTKPFVFVAIKLWTI